MAIWIRVKITRDDQVNDLTAFFEFNYSVPYQVLMRRDLEDFRSGL